MTSGKMRTIAEDIKRRWNMAQTLNNEDVKKQKQKQKTRREENKKEFIYRHCS